MASIIFRRNRPNLPGGSPTTKLIGWGLVVVALGVFFFSNRSEPPDLCLTEASLAEVWNEAAAALDREVLFLGDLQETQDDVVGFAWTDDLLILARLGEGEAGDRPVAELAAVGSPSRDGIDNVLAVLELVIAVSDPSLTRSDRATILDELTLVEENRPAQINAVVQRGNIEYRATSDVEDDEIGIGAVPLT